MVNDYNTIKIANGDCDREVLCRLHKLGIYYKDKGEHVIALRYMSQCLQNRIDTFGLKDEDTMMSQYDIGVYFLLLQRAADGTKMLRECLSNRTEVFGVNSVLTWDTMGALG